MEYSGKTNGKFGQTQWENLGKSNEKTRKAAAYKNYFGQKLLLLPGFRLLLYEFPIAFCHRNHDIAKPVFESMLQEALLRISKKQQ